MKPLVGVTALEKVLFGALPSAYPVSNESAGPQSVPCLARTALTDIPSELVACNALGRALQPEEAGVHFFKGDRQFLRTLTEPLQWMPRLHKFKSVLTPDYSLGIGMPPWQRARNVVLSRATGVVWQSRGLTVIPTLRWIGPEDFELVSSGVPTKSVFAVSSYAARREPACYANFKSGLVAMMDLLEPQGIILYGSVDEETLHQAQDKTNVFRFGNVREFDKASGTGRPELSQLF